MKNTYKEEIIESIETLVNFRYAVFERALNISMKGELKETDEVFNDGDLYDFKLGHIDNSSDVNVQKLVDLIKHIESTAESIANINAIDLDQYDV